MPSDAPHPVPLHVDVSESAEAILAAALSLIGEQGLPALTLRHLAKRLGVSVPTITHHLGAKGELLAKLIRYAHACDGRWARFWLGCGKTLSASDFAERARLIDHALDGWTREGRAQAVLYCELMRQPPNEPGAREAFAAWAGERCLFWTSLAGAPALGTVLNYYVADEAAFSLSLGHLPAYRLLRSICLAGLIAGLQRGAAARGQAATVFERVQQELAPPVSVLDTLRQGLQNAKRTELARSAGQLIVDQGVEALTHRSVAVAAGSTPSTVVYHFGAREELAVAGLESVIGEFHQWLGATRKASGPDPSDEDLMVRTRMLVRATNAIANGAIWYPSLVPHAGDMRRRRGENIAGRSLPGLSLTGALDPCAAQIVSVATFGARLVAGALGLNERDVVEDLFRVLNESA